MKQKQQVFAIVRLDDFQDPAIPVTNRITVKEIVYDQRTAEDEVRRLNEINGSKGCTYFWQATRLVERS
jgi:hypothetical protein